jgi:predicted 2-oxoglutarate/Fe(II)-dependent dioxygenase YbiX
MAEIHDQYNQFFYTNLEAISIDLCEQLKKDFETLEFVEAKVYNPVTPNIKSFLREAWHPSRRTCEINADMNCASRGEPHELESLNQMASLMNTYLKSVNRTIFKVDCPDELSDIQIIKYDSKHKQDTKNLPHFDWHIDDMWNQQNEDHIRKLTMTCVISDGEKDFEGGNVEFDVPEGALDYDGRKQGSMIMFPSFLKHRVSDVTSGLRYAINAWVYGPSWR